MTTPTDAIGLSERLRKTLAGVEPDDFGGDNLAIFIASELEPSIDDETLDDSGTWKQGAIDACDRVLDAIHAHYATAIDALLKERDALNAAYLQSQTDFQNALGDRDEAIKQQILAEQERDALQARVKELEYECFRLAADTCHAGYGDEHGHHRCREVDQANARALRAEQDRDEAYERLSIAANYFNRYCQDEAAEPELCVSDQHHEDAKAFEECIRRLAGPEKEGK